MAEAGNPSSILQILKQFRQTGKDWGQQFTITDWHPSLTIKKVTNQAIACSALDSEPSKDVLILIHCAILHSFDWWSQYSTYHKEWKVMVHSIHESVKQR